MEESRAVFTGLVEGEGRTKRALDASVPLLCSGPGFEGLGRYEMGNRMGMRHRPFLDRLHASGLLFGSPRSVMFPPRHSKVRYQAEPPFLQASDGLNWVASVVVPSFLFRTDRYVTSPLNGGSHTLFSRWLVPGIGGRSVVSDTIQLFLPCDEAPSSPAAACASLAPLLGVQPTCRSASCPRPDVRVEGQAFAPRVPSQRLCRRPPQSHHLLSPVRTHPLILLPPPPTNASAPNSKSCSTPCPATPCPRRRSCGSRSARRLC